MGTINANDPSLTSWIEVEKNSDFPIQNLPFGIFKTETLKEVSLSQEVISPIFKILAKNGHYELTCATN